MKKHLNYNLINTHSSEDGRIVLINIKVEDKELTLMNLYAPNHSCERKHFFHKIQKWITNYSQNKEEIIIGGDFNFTEFNNLDRKNITSIANDVSSVTYKSLIAKHELCDIWRIMHPNRKQFTYQEQSRLDKFLVTSISSNYIQSSSIFHSGIKSDHKCVKITMNLKESKRGPVYGK